MLVSHLLAQQSCCPSVTRHVRHWQARAPVCSEPQQNGLRAEPGSDQPRSLAHGGFGCPYKWQSALTFRLFIAEISYQIVPLSPGDCPSCHSRQRTAHPGHTATPLPGMSLEAVSLTRGQVCWWPGHLPAPSLHRRGGGMCPSTVVNTFSASSNNYICFRSLTQASCLNLMNKYMAGIFFC